MESKISNDAIANAIGSIVKEKSLAPDIVVETIREAITQAVKKYYGNTDNIRITIEPDMGMLKVEALKKVVRTPKNKLYEISKRDAVALDPNATAGDEMWVTLDLSTFGRNAIQLAKQQIIQRILDAEREQVYQDYQDRVGEVMTGIVQRTYRGSVYLNIGQVEGMIPGSEMIPGEKLSIGRNVRALVIGVVSADRRSIWRLIPDGNTFRKEYEQLEKEARGAQIILSRRSPEFLRKLFEFEVPEIYDGIVQIVSVAREPGERSKIAVYSTEDRIDPVGACVGLKGSRVQAVVKELNNEKIDIIEYSLDPKVYVTKALAPATVLSCDIFKEQKHITIIVPDDQLSLAIGTKGRNARLAAKLTGWRITLLSESQLHELDVPIERMESLTDAQLTALRNLSIHTVQMLARINIEILQSMESFKKDAMDKIREAQIFVEKINEERAFVTRVDRVEQNEN